MGAAVAAIKSGNHMAASAFFLKNVVGQGAKA